MSLGTKLQGVANKVNTKLGTQDGTIVFRKITIDDGAEFGQAYDSATNSDVTITAGIKIGRVKAYETVQGGLLQEGDLKLIVPGSLVTEAQLTGAQILYGGESYAIVSRRPLQIFSGVTVEWEVIGRIRP